MPGGKSAAKIAADHHLSSGAPYNRVVSAIDNLAVVYEYLQAISSNVPVEELLGFLAPEIVQEEMPNMLKPQGDSRGRAELQRDYERGRQMIASQRYDIQSSIAMGDTVSIEVIWTGRLAVAVGDLPQGAEMRARCAIFFEFQDGKIVRQRNYDCFETF